MGFFLAHPFHIEFNRKIIIQDKHNGFFFQVQEYDPFKFLIFLNY